ncbi:MAG: DUF1254 domain-containing protein [Thermoleophilaceae bacterium]|nr:DUF1254 domain-containing protein [Thermoleophilaceae bacterium]
MSTRIFIAAALAALYLAAPAAATAAPPTPGQAEQLGRDAYRYGFPLLEILRVRAEQTSVRCPDVFGDAPVNSFSHSGGFARPKDRTVVAPNTDTLYSIAHLDLGRGPVVLRHPGMGRRYFVFELVDPYTNVIGYIGTRTTGSDAGRFAISWNRRRAPKPRNVESVIHSQFRRVWIIGRTLTTDAADQRKAQKLMHRYRLYGPNGRPRAFSKSCRPGKPDKPRTPTHGPRFLRALARGMTENPPPKRDRPLLRRLATVGIGPGRTPAEANLPADVVAAVHAGVAAEAAEMPGSIRTTVLQRSIAAGGWAVLPPAIGDYGTDYDLRAAVAVVGLGANTPAEAIYPTALTDSSGALLDGAAHDYRMVFPPGGEPPVRYFWSLTMYDLDGFLVKNPIRRYSLGPTHPPLRRRADGSIVIAIQQDRPAEKGVNWLPAPVASFRLNLRLFGPRKAARTGTWKAPPVVPVG